MDSTQRYEFLRLSIPTGHVLLVELNRPPVNAFNSVMFKEFDTLFASLADGSFTFPGDNGEDIRCIVLSSSLPKIFTAGIDHDLLASISPSSSSSDPSRAGIELHGKILALQRTLTLLTSSHLLIPIVVAIHGQCIGLGVDIAAACDVRLGVEGGVFCIKEPALSLVPDVGTLARLPHVTSNGSLLAELTLTARNFDVHEAKELGLISRVVQIDNSIKSGAEDGDAARKAVLKEALNVAEQIAKLSPVAIAGVKKVIGVGRERSVAENLEYVAAWNAFALQTPDIQKSIVGIKTKKTPTFDSLHAPSPKSKL